MSEEERAQAGAWELERMATVGRAATGVIHELNNILSSLYGFAQLARRQPAYRDTLVDAMEEQGRRAGELTRQFMDLARDRPPVMELTDLVEVLRRVALLMEYELGTRDIELLVDVPTVPPPRALVYPGRLAEALLNLVINARNALNRGGTITLGLALETGPLPTMNVFVADDGPGIAPEIQQHIFEPFFTTRAAEGGTGLGLAFVQETARLHGGTVKLDSAPGKGARFVLCLPHHGERRREAQAVGAERRRTPSRPGRRILVVDDEAAIGGLVIGALSEHHVTYARCGRDALEACRGGGFDLVLLDINMSGGLDGFQTFAELQRLCPATRVLIMTGRAMDAELKALIVKSVGLLAKPFSLDELAELVGRAGGTASV